MIALLRDLRFALRMLFKSPAFTLIANPHPRPRHRREHCPVLRRQRRAPESAALPALQPARRHRRKKRRPGQGAINYLNFLDWQRQTKAFSSIAMYRHEDYNFTGTGQPARQRLHDLRGILPHPRPPSGSGAGDFNPDERSPRRRARGPAQWTASGIDVLAARPAFSERPSTSTAPNYTVVGILPPSFLFHGIDRDLYTPLGQWNEPSLPRSPHRRKAPTPSAASKPGVTLQQASADMDSIAHHLAVTYPEADKDVGIALYSMKERHRRQCAALPDRAAGRRSASCSSSRAPTSPAFFWRAPCRDPANSPIRSALGASRTRIIRQLLTESTLLAGLGGALGFLLAFFGTKSHHQRSARRAPALQRSVPRRFASCFFALAVSLAAGIVFGLAARTQNLTRQFAADSSPVRARCSGARHRLQGIFVAAEVAMALVLLVGAGSCCAPWRLSGASVRDTIPATPSTFSVSLPSNAKTTAAETRARLRRFDAAHARHSRSSGGFPSPSARAP